MRTFSSRGAAGLCAWALLATAAPTAPGPGAVLVRCESFRLRPHACPAASDANVRLVKVLGGRCLAGLTWFYDRRAIHVRGGCRAVFAVGGAPQNVAAPSARR
ncbi:MAG: DUF3011 domain-containing protein [Caulobacteraceae bacterium]